MSRKVKELQMNDFAFKASLSPNSVFITKTTKKKIIEGQRI